MTRDQLDKLLERAVENGASDIHLSTGIQPILRIDGSLRRLEDLPPLEKKI